MFMATQLYNMCLLLYSYSRISIYNLVQSILYKFKKKNCYIFNGSLQFPFFHSGIKVFVTYYIYIYFFLYECIIIVFRFL